MQKQSFIASTRTAGMQILVPSVAFGSSPDRRRSAYIAMKIVGGSDRPIGRLVSIHWRRIVRPSQLISGRTVVDSEPASQTTPVLFDRSAIDVGLGRSVGYRRRSWSIGRLSTPVLVDRSAIDAGLGRSAT